jgi:molybdopterin molybdotransferase
MDSPKSLHELAAASDYDPDSMPVDKAREHIRAFLSPVTVVERLNIRAALGRVLAEDVISPVDVPQHDNSAMDGYAVRFADLRQDGESTLSDWRFLRGQAFVGTLSVGQVVRIMTGAVARRGRQHVQQEWPGVG